ncbi:hypothetical protein MIND_00353300 [Mycena indigotica]|uniref:GTPase activating protein n=1 Tax=Mycena indigotica TaxID=2126181 RepID=A0A8H6T2P8_9AGAR|nr:uncharacterized protein MIND_00353300 [Mycena indigotica]KAF7309814.1 hypothetical protein MIND_00353300 [Mycena indigotica]
MTPSAARGLVVVLIEGGSDVSEKELTAWYEEEHVPRRLTLAGFDSAFRYKAIDSKTPTWLTVYDIEAPEIANSPAYLALADQASDNEKAILAKLSGLSRRTYAHIRTFSHPDTNTNDLPTQYLLAVGFIMKSTEGEAELDKWYNEEHMELLSKVPGWKQGRRFVLTDHTARGEFVGQPVHNYFALHSFDNKDFADTVEFKQATSTEWRAKVMDLCISREARTFELYKNFGVATNLDASLMGEDSYPNSQWDPADNSDYHSGPSSYHHPVQLIDRSESSPPAASQPRSSSDSAWRDTNTLENDSLPPNESVTLVDATFDENILRSLCELDCGVPLLLDRIKQSMISCREASVFLKKRAAIEEEYGKTMHKLARTTAETYGMHDGKAGTFVASWQSAMKTHEAMGESRLRFAQRLNEMSEELATLVKEVEKNRKQTKELATRYERALQESEAVTEKSKNRLDIASEELERVLLQKEGESLKDNTVQQRAGGAGGKRAIGKAVAKGGLLLKGKNPGNIQRQEDDIRTRVSNASDAYRKAVTDTQAMRQEYFNFQLPRILRALKECADEMDLGTQYHLTRYAFLFESTILGDGSTLVPPPGEEGSPLNPGLKATLEMIDNRGDFKAYMHNYAYVRGPATPRGPRREGPSEEGFLPPLPPHQPATEKVSQASNGVNGAIHATFGVDLADQMARDNVEVPPIMEKCCQAIEKYGLESQGIYRVSGTVTRVANLRQRLDRDLDSVDLDSHEWSSDINNVSSVLKMWLRELPDPLLTFELQQGFVDAAKIENERLRHIRLHERVNDLPDANYATLKYFMGHLHRINQHAAENSMSIQNLAIVFGPTLFGQMRPTEGGAIPMPDTTNQNLAIETILTHYTDIFVDESEQ